MLSDQSDRRYAVSASKAARTFAGCVLRASMSASTLRFGADHLGSTRASTPF
jgi:hypothetical protein